MKTYRAIMMGFGNVGRSVAELLLERGPEVERAHGVAVRLVLVADRSGVAVDAAGLDLQRLLDVKRRHSGVAAYPAGGRPGLGGAEAVAMAATELGADLLLEASPTSVHSGEPGLTHIRAALEHGLHVVNANKGPLVVAYHDLMRLAAARGVRLRNAATVGAPLPTLELMRYALPGVTVLEIEAIPNGTTNYILGLMEEGRSLEDGIAAAQEAGIAETDPSLDVEGWDSAAKIIILANALMGADARLADVAVEGIGGVTGPELAQMRQEGLALKLLATARRGATEDGDADENNDLELSVAPTPLPLDHPLARLHYTGMGVVLHTDVLGDLTVSVEGDTPLGTAQAMLRDVVNLGQP